MEGRIQERKDNEEVLIITSSESVKATDAEQRGKSSSGWGGKRRNAGRKPKSEKKVKVNLRLSSLAATLLNQTKEKSKTADEAIVAYLRKRYPQIMKELGN